LEKKTPYLDGDFYLIGARAHVDWLLTRSFGSVNGNALVWARRMVSVLSRSHGLVLGRTQALNAKINLKVGQSDDGAGVARPNGLGQPVHSYGVGVQADVSRVILRGLIADWRLFLKAGTCGRWPIRYYPCTWCHPRVTDLGARAD